jgi:FKBP-type peptidyl-prolyl cis-trans isomerase SlyD
LLIAKDAVALLEYTLKNDSGELLDASAEGQPLAYIHGRGNLIPGLEQELEGKQSGDHFEIRIPPEEAYGERNQELVHPVNRDQLPDEIEVEVGLQLRAESEAGAQIVTVVGVEDDRVLLDANHPLAGVALNFDVKVAEVREATAEELEHGHVHGTGGHHH